MRLETTKTDNQYAEMLEYFGTPKAMAEYFECSIQAIFQWKHGVPKTRIREFNLIKDTPLNNEAA